MRPCAHQGSPRQRPPDPRPRPRAQPPAQAGTSTRNLPPAHSAVLGGSSPAAGGPWAPPWGCCHRLRVIPRQEPAHLGFPRPRACVGSTACVQPCLKATSPAATRNGNDLREVPEGSDCRKEVIAEKTPEGSFLGEIDRFENAHGSAKNRAVRRP